MKWGPLLLQFREKSRERSQSKVWGKRVSICDEGRRRLFFIVFFSLSPPAQNRLVRCDSGVVCRELACAAAAAAVGRVFCRGKLCWVD